MSGESKIEWTGKVWNPVRGCAKVSEGCRNCYAMRQAHRFSGEGRPYEGLTRLSDKGPVWTGRAVEVPGVLDRPLRWKKPARIFVNSMSDLFHEDVRNEFIAAAFGVMALAPQHTFQLLTKRPERMRAWFRDFAGELPLLAERKSTVSTCVALMESIAYGMDNVGKLSAPETWPLPNVHIGVSVEDQEAANKRVPLLLETPAAVRWLSMEPLLGPVDMEPILHVYDRNGEPGWLRQPGLDWVVVGGESGPGARPMSPQWVRDIRDQCAEAGVPFFFKQWGAWATPSQVPAATFEGWDAAENAAGNPDLDRPLRFGKRAAGRLLDGRTWDEVPA